VIEVSARVRTIGKRRKIGALAISFGLLVLLTSNGHVARAQQKFLGPSILPPAPDAIFGGNPFQGLGRSDDPGPSREQQYGFPTYNNSSFNANHMQDQPAPTYYSDSYAVYPHPENSTSGSNSSAGAGTTAGDRLSQNAQSGATGYGNQGYANQSFGAQPGNGSGNSGYGGSGPGTIGPGSGSNGYANNGYANNSYGSNGPVGGGPGGFNSGGASAGGFGTGSGAGSGFGSGFGGPSANGFPEGYVPTSALDVPSKPSGQSTENSWPSGNTAGTSTFSNNSTFAPGFGGQAGFGTPLTPDEITQRAAGNQNTAFKQQLMDANNQQTRPNDSKGNRSLFGDIYGRTGQSGNNPNQQAPDALSHPESPLAETGLNFKSDLPKKHPLGEAMKDIKGGRLQDAINHLNEVLQYDQDNANAHYLKAVVSVLTRNYDQAKQEYQETLRLSQNSELTRRAQIGLNKLTH
jgi:hypothetical protein